MKIVSSMAALALAALPGLAQAQEFSGAVTLGYGNTDISDVTQDITTRTFDGRAEVGFGNGLSFGARFDTINGSIDGISNHVSGNLFGLSLDYRFANGVKVGVYHEKAWVGISGLTGSLSARSYGLDASYDMNGLEVGGFYGRKTSDNIPGSIDFHDYGLNAKYSVSDQMMVGGSIARTRVSSGGSSVDLDLIGIAGNYAFNDQWSAFGGISRSTVDIVSLSTTTYGLGVAYDLSAATSFGGIASLELARTNADISGSGGSLNTVRVGFTLPFGANASKVPLNSVADSVLNPSHAVLSSTVLAAF